MDEDEIKLAKTQKHDIDVVIDRIIIKEGIRSRLFDSVQTALQRANGLMALDVLGGSDKGGNKIEPYENYFPKN